MDDEPMWAADRVVALSPGFVTTIPKTTNEFVVKAGGIFLYTTPNQAYQLLENKVLLKLDRAKNQKTKSSLKKALLSPLKQLSDFIKAQHSTNSFVKDTFMDLKNKPETTTKNHQASIQNLEAKFDRFANKQSCRPSGSIPSNTQPNPKGSSSKPYQPPQARNEHVNSISTRSGKSYDLLVNPNNQQNDYETLSTLIAMMKTINLHLNLNLKTQKPVKEIPKPKPYKPKVPYPQRLRKEKMEAQYGKFLDMIRVVQINVPLVDVLAGMPNYGNFSRNS
nr:reverse transcriptase domain-containing protein [Tanacetum cinerariifolium]